VESRYPQALVGLFEETDALGVESELEMLGGEEAEAHQDVLQLDDFETTEARFTCMPVYESSPPDYVVRSLQEPFQSVIKEQARVCEAHWDRDEVFVPFLIRRPQPTGTQPTPAGQDINNHNNDSGCLAAATSAPMVLDHGNNSFKNDANNVIYNANDSPPHLGDYHLDSNHKPSLSFSFRAAVKRMDLPEKYVCPWDDAYTYPPSKLIHRFGFIWCLVFFYYEGHRSYPDASEKGVNQNL
jgi:hypothetical protein